MKRFALILLILSTFAIKANAQGESLPRMTFGAEWSYISTIHSSWHYNFFSSEGYRVNLKGSEIMHHSNAEAFLKAGYNFNENWNLALYVGIAGIGNVHKALPVSLRSTCFFGKEYMADRWFSFIEAGSGISLKLPPQEIFACKAGGGYRISLSRNTKMDFIVAVKVNYTHPDVIYEDVRIEHDRINRNGMTLTSVSVGMAINI